VDRRLELKMTAGPMKICETLEVAARFCNQFKHWSNVNWWASNIIAAIQISLSAVVPFGLAALLYIPEEHRGLLNMIVLIVSLLAFGLQLVARHLSLAQRAARLRRAWIILEKALPYYRDRLIGEEQFLAEFDKALLFLQEEADTNYNA
jgi:hypothetical protein